MYGDRFVEQVAALHKGYNAPVCMRTDVAHLCIIVVETIRATRAHICVPVSSSEMNKSNNIQMITEPLVNASEGNGTEGNT